VSGGKGQRASDLHFQGSRLRMSLASAQDGPAGERRWNINVTLNVDKAHDEFIQRSVRR
jgi:hypothetical protein